MTSTAKALFKAVFPFPASYLAAYRTRAHIDSLWGHFQRSFADTLYGARTPVVLSGPFAGIKYLNDIVYGCITPKWIGSYEAELHPVIEGIIGRGYRTVFDVGAAEGYYLAGLASRMPETVFYGFDTDPLARGQQKKLLALNGLGNVHVGSYCTAAWLNANASPDALLICDIEGYELPLLNPRRAPRLKHLDMLVELHPYAPLEYAEVKRTLVERFSGTHQITCIATRKRDRAFYHTLTNQLFPDDQMRTALDEGRFPGQEWLWMQRR